MKHLSILALFLGQFILGQQFSKDEVTLINKGNITELLPIYQTTESHQHEVLLKQSIDIDPLNPNTKILVDRMKLSLLSTKGGVGIAGPQVGVNRKVIWVKRFDKEGTPLEYFLNPVITWKSELQNLGPEGDLSIPDFREQFYRSKVIKLHYQTLDGKHHEELVEGFTAVIFQHEIDHLFGILIKDKKEKEAHNSYQKVEAFLPTK